MTPAEKPSSLRPLGVIALGVFAIAVLTPATQLLTYLTVQDAIETATPVGWAVGALFSLVLTLVVLRRLGAPGLLSKSSLALLYAMLALAVPLMNLGLVRPFFLSVTMVYREHIDESNNTYRTAYAALKETWSPRIPTRGGMAWLQAERALLLLQDRAEQHRAAGARRVVGESLERRAPAPAAAREAVALLAPDDVATLLRDADPGFLAGAGIEAALRARLEAATAASARAAETLLGRLGEAGEPEISYMPSVFAATPAAQRLRLEETLARWSVERARDFAERVKRLAGEEAALRAAASSLGAGDRVRVHTELASRFERRLAALPEDSFEEARAEFVLRLSRNERKRLLRLTVPGGPNDNLHAFRYGLWDDPLERQARDSRGVLANLRDLAGRLPWQLWLGPLTRWGLLFTSIYLLLMCLAEWLRRKWIERENLAFPLVEFADHLIRHDFRLELSADVQNPEPRKRTFYPLFWIGFAIGFALLLAEVLGHYGWLPMRPLLVLNFNEAVFDRIGGAFRTLPQVVFVASPIIIGLGYLLSLQMSLSIWCTFLGYTLVVWGVRNALPDIRDSNYTGFEGGKLYPFAMEQLLGAAAVFALFLFWQAWRARPAPARKDGAAAPPADPFIARWPMRLGFALLPPAILWLLWDLGVRHVPLLLLTAVVLLVQAIVVARARAETGLPPLPAFYEMTKLPMVFGMTGAVGARVFTVFTQVVFLPATMLLRTLPQHLENIELARRHKLPGRWMAIGGLAAFATALVVGLLSFLVLAYFFGSDFYSDRHLPPYFAFGSINYATYPLWVSHFLGEPGLSRFDQVIWLRVGFIGIGGAVVALLLAARQRFLGFPLHPLGYLITLLSIYFWWTTPYARADGYVWETSILWGGVFIAWLIKTLVVKYGGMIAYKRGKPAFVGLVAGAVFCVFLANVLHLAVRLLAGGQAGGGAFVQAILERAAFSPLLY